MGKLSSDTALTRLSITCVGPFERTYPLKKTKWLTFLQYASNACACSQ